ncbi:hypothetical protein BK816_08700 [Boudabousia tangfeifanii]|uniref:Glycine transporter domain-containing protein n=1 Tax=Boudabousia tangfeifanii TaxID=1912795 RepID=A0A1D9MMG8_9ACTO|nr:hypothetical protein BK816_08700 [Boudabousia tangfeifanii]
MGSIWAAGWGADNINITLESMFRYIDLTGVFLNGIIGGRLARQKRFDAVGFLVLAILSGMGGGIIRDVMLQAGPPFALTDKYYLYIAMAGALTALLFRLGSKWAVRFVIVADGVVLGVWAATGVIKTMNLGFGPMPALMMGMLTAIGGGMIRDISAGNIPMVFGGNYLYATPAAAASLTTLGFWYWDEQRLGMLASLLVGFSIVILAHWRKWTLPDAEALTIKVSGTQLKRMLKRQRAMTIERAVEQAVAAATEAATEAASAAATEAATQAATEAATEAVEAAVEAATEAATQAATEAASHSLAEHTEGVEGTEGVKPGDDARQA